MCEIRRDGFRSCLTLPDMRGTRVHLEEEVVILPDVHVFRFEHERPLVGLLRAIDLALLLAGRHEKRAILVLSDGEDTLSAAGLDDAAAALKRAGVPLYAIGIEFGQDLYARRAPPDSLWRRLEVTRA